MSYTARSAWRCGPRQPRRKAENHLGAADRASLRARFMRKLVRVSDGLWKPRFWLRGRGMYARHGMSMISAHIQHLRRQSRTGPEGDPVIDGEGVGGQVDLLPSDGSDVDMGTGEE